MKDDDEIDYENPRYLPSGAQYAEFFRSELTILQKEMLLAHYAAPEHCANNAEIGLAIGKKMETVNSAAGRVGRKIVERYGTTMPKRAQVSHALSWFRHGDDGHYYATMHGPVVAAIEALGWGDTARSRFGDYWSTVGRKPPAETYWEGWAREAAIISRSRNGQARRECIAHWKCRCYVCKFDFAAVYGALGEGFIEVHHLEPVSGGPEDGYEIDPIKDLRPVCSNCHRMLHRDGVGAVDELRNVVRTRSAKNWGVSNRA